MADVQPSKPWWEQRPKSPGEGGFEAERERLRAELARAWRSLAASQHQAARRGAAGPIRPVRAA